MVIDKTIYAQDANYLIKIWAKSICYLATSTSLLLPNGKCNSIIKFNIKNCKLYMKKLMYILSWPFALMATGWGAGVCINLLEGNFEKIPEGIGYTVIFGIAFSILYYASNQK
jgi:hypothetical protein